jgi:hypothetical protein
LGPHKGFRIWDFFDLGFGISDLGLSRFGISDLGLIKGMLSIFDCLELGFGDKVTRFDGAQRKLNAEPVNLYQ